MWTNLKPRKLCIQSECERKDRGRRQDAARRLTVLVGDNGPLRPTGVGAESDFIFEETADSVSLRRHLNTTNGTPPVDVPPLKGSVAD